MHGIVTTSQNTAGILPQSARNVALLWQLLKHKWPSDIQRHSRWTRICYNSKDFWRSQNPMQLFLYNQIHAVGIYIIHGANYFDVIQNNECLLVSRLQYVNGLHDNGLIRMAYCRFNMGFQQSGSYVRPRTIGHPLCPFNTSQYIKGNDCSIQNKSVYPRKRLFENKLTDTY